MKMFLTIFLSMSIFVSTTLLAQNTVAQNGKLEKWLFVQTGVSGSLTAVPGERDSYILTLRGVDPQTIAFTDRPSRNAKKISVTQFVDGWSNGDDSFKKNPPNAALHIGGTKSEVIVMIIDNPEYDEKAGKITYKAKHLKFEKSNGDILPTMFTNPILFIDDDFSWLGA